MADKQLPKKDQELPTKPPDLPAPLSPVQDDEQKSPLGQKPNDRPSSASSDNSSGDTDTGKILVR